jgi:hypothetical protein
LALPSTASVGEGETLRAQVDNGAGGLLMDKRVDQSVALRERQARDSRRAFSAAVDRAAQSRRMHRKKKRPDESGRKDSRTRAAAQSLSLLPFRGQSLEREAEKFADAGVLLSREPFQGCALIRGDAHRNLAMWIAGGFAAVEIESGDCRTDDFARGGEAVAFAAGLDSRDERFGKIERERGRGFAR